MLQHPEIVPKCVVRGISQKIPAEFLLLIPFFKLRQLIAHKIELFPRMGKHIEIEGAELMEFLLVISCNFIDDGLFPMHHFIVGERQ